MAHFSQEDIKGHY